MHPADDTIFALASGPTKAGVAVMRISGPNAGKVLQALSGTLPEARQATLVTLRHPSSGDVLDRALCVRFEAPASFTGEDVLELHLHGGLAVISSVAGALSSSGLRPAEAGEFTRRAFLNGKLDLDEAEALADLIDAETDAQRRQALRGMDHGLGELAEHWRDQLIVAAALLESQIDFSDEDDVPDDVLLPVRNIINEVSVALSAALDDGGRGERLRTGLLVVIAGPPNAGKSSLFNRLAKRPVAIVSPYAGTTRDALEVHLDLDGYPITLVDTAGLRDSEDPVEQEGVRRGKVRLDQADVILWVNAPDVERVEPPARFEARILNVEAKSDIDSAMKHCDALGVSAETGEGIDYLLRAISSKVRHAFSGEAPVITRARHRQSLTEALGFLEAAHGGTSVELMAEDMRLASRALGRIAGRVDSEMILDAVFSRFCIGK